MGKKTPDIPETFKVVARTPSEVLYEGMCRAVNGENRLGPFTVLPGHQNFVTNVSRVVSLVLEDKKTKEIEVQVGVVHVKANEVQIFVILQPES